MANNKWHFHPKVRSGSELSRGERAADSMRNGMGSWPFVFGALAFLGAWMTLNALLGKSGFDKYPFILLNLVLSCLAAMQGAILLIAAKRSDAISAELAQHTYQIDQETLDVAMQIAELTQQVHSLTEAVYKHIGAEESSK
jgi:uncharacterized membrane protein